MNDSYVLLSQRDGSLKSGRGGRYLKPRLASWLSGFRHSKLERH
jgi:hypothetical protein